MNNPAKVSRLERMGKGSMTDSMARVRVESWRGQHRSRRAGTRVTLAARNGSPLRVRLGVSDFCLLTKVAGEPREFQKQRRDRERCC